MKTFFSEQELRGLVCDPDFAVDCVATLDDGRQVGFKGTLMAEPEDVVMGTGGGLGQARRLVFVTSDCPDLQMDDELIADGERFEVREVRPGDAGASRAALKLIRGALPV